MPGPIITTLAATALIAGGVLGGIALDPPPRGAKPGDAARTTPVEVRTRVVRRTVHVVLHQRIKRRPPAAATQAVPGTRPVGDSVRAPSTTKPLVTRTSPSSGSRDESEHEVEGHEADD
jgi:hypothetical protein